MYIHRFQRPELVQMLLLYISRDKMVIDSSQPLWITDDARRYATDDDVMLLPYKHYRFSASSRQASVREAIQQRQS